MERPAPASEGMRTIATSTTGIRASHCVMTETDVTGTTRIVAEDEKVTTIMALEEAAAMVVTTAMAGMAFRTGETAIVTTDTRAAGSVQGTTTMTTTMNEAAEVAVAIGGAPKLGIAVPLSAAAQHQKELFLSVSDPGPTQSGTFPLQVLKLPARLPPRPLACLASPARHGW